MNEMNRIHNMDNPYQQMQKFKRVLCVCSAGLLRSPTAAFVLSLPPFNCNTRAAGVESSYALVPVDAVLLLWAQEIVCMTREHEAALRWKIANDPLIEESEFKTPIITLEVPDNFAYRDPELMEIIAHHYTEATKET